MAAKTDKFPLRIIEKRQKNEEILFVVEDNQISQRLKCEKCKQIIIQPCQTHCGLRFCLKCFESSIKKGTAVCQWCNEDVSTLKEKVMHDKATENEIFKLNVKCINKECETICIFKDLKNHLETCDYNEEKCDKCGDWFFYKNKNEHVSMKCKNIVLNCPDCGKNKTREEMEMVHRNIHLVDLNDLCEKWISSCPYNCGLEIPDTVKSHLLVCVKRPIPCIMQRIGCQKRILKEDMEDHIREDVKIHWDLMRLTLDKIEKKEESEKQLSNKYQNAAEVDVSKLLKINSQFQKTIVELNYKLADLQSQIGNRIPETVTDFCSLKNHRLLSDNVFTWVIENVTEKYESAKQGYQTQILSDPFYTNTPGYKMCLKVYPNGDGKAKDKYLSLYFVIMRGEYDDRISWPFQKKISLCVISREVSISTTKVNMRPDSNTSCYGKPVSEYNVGAGQPEFVKLEELMIPNKYIINDNLSIRITVVE